MINIYVYREERKTGGRRRHRRREKKAGLMEEVQGRGSLFFSLSFFIVSDSRIEESEFHEAFYESLCLRVLRGNPLRRVDLRM